MSAAEDMLALLFEARPVKPALPPPRVTVLRSPHVEVGGVSFREHSLCGQVECKKCEQPRRQQLIQRTFAGGELWSVLPCTNCGGLR